MLKTKAIFHRKEPEFRTEDCVVEKVVELGDAEYCRFRRNMLGEYDFIADNANAMSVDRNGVSHCLLVVSKSHGDGVLVRSEGSSYARYAALLPNVHDILAAQRITSALAELNQKLTDLADHAAIEVLNLAKEGQRMELSINDVARGFGIDMEGNGTLWNTLPDMIAERLNSYGLEIEIGKNELVVTRAPEQNLQMQSMM